MNPADLQPHELMQQPATRGLSLGAAGRSFQVGVSAFCGITIGAHAEARSR